MAKAKNGGTTVPQDVRDRILQGLRTSDTSLLHNPGYRVRIDPNYPDGVHIEPIPAEEAGRLEAAAKSEQEEAEYYAEKDAEVLQRVADGRRTVDPASGRTLVEDTPTVPAFDGATS
jgi:hypothetical protein